MIFILKLLSQSQVFLLLEIAVGKDKTETAFLLTATSILPVKAVNICIILFIETSG